MTREVVFDDERITVWVDPAVGLIEHEMHAPCFEQVFRDALSSGVEAMREHRATKWMSDDRANGALSPEDESWAKNTWFPSALEAGWKHWALVQPEAVVGQMNMRRFTETYAALGITVRVFSDPEEARAWIRAV